MKILEYYFIWQIFLRIYSVAVQRIIIFLWFYGGLDPSSPTCQTVLIAPTIIRRSKSERIICQWLFWARTKNHNSIIITVIQSCNNFCLQGTLEEWIGSHKEKKHHVIMTLPRHLFCPFPSRCLNPQVMETSPR